MGMDTQESLLRLCVPWTSNERRPWRRARSQAGASNGLHDSQVLARAHALSIAPVGGSWAIWSGRCASGSTMMRPKWSCAGACLGLGSTRPRGRPHGTWCVLTGGAWQTVTSRWFTAPWQRGWLGCPWQSTPRSSRHGDGGGGSAGTEVRCKPVAGERTVAGLARGASRAGHEAALLACIGMGADARLPDASGNTPLHHAARFGHASLVTPLVEAGSDVAALNAHGWAPLPCRPSHARPGLPPPDGPRRQS